MHHLFNSYYYLITHDVMKHCFELCKYVIGKQYILFGKVFAIYILSNRLMKDIYLLFCF